MKKTSKPKFLKFRGGRATKVFKPKKGRQAFKRIKKIDPKET